MKDNTPSNIKVLYHKVIIRRATPNDASGICETHIRAIREICCADYAAHQIEAWTRNLIPDRYLKPIQNGCFFVADIKGSIAGFSEYDRDTAELRAVYVNPDFKRLGVGKSLFEVACKEAAGDNIRQLWFESSITASPFYQSMGCVVQNEALHRFSSGVEMRCLRMIKDIA